MKNNDTFEFKFTGKATLIIEMEDSNPMEMQVDDMPMVTQLVKTFTEDTTSFTVDPYSEKHGRKLQKLFK